MKITTLLRHFDKTITGLSSELCRKNLNDLKRAVLAAPLGGLQEPVIERLDDLISLIKDSRAGMLSECQIRASRWDLLDLTRHIYRTFDEPEFEASLFVKKHLFR